MYVATYLIKLISLSVYAFFVKCMALKCDCTFKISLEPMMLPFFFFAFIHNIVSSNIYNFLRTQWQFSLIVSNIVDNFKEVLRWLDGVMVNASEYYLPESGIGSCLNTVVQILTCIFWNETVWQFWVKLSSFLLWRPKNMLPFSNTE